MLCKIVNATMVGFSLGCVVGMVERGYSNYDKAFIHSHAMNIIESGVFSIGMFGMDRYRLGPLDKSEASRNLVYRSLGFMAGQTLIKYLL